MCEVHVAESGSFTALFLERRREQIQGSRDANGLDIARDDSPGQNNLSNVSAVPAPGGLALGLARREIFIGTC